MLTRVGRVLVIAVLLLVGTLVLDRFVPGLTGRVAMGVTAGVLLLADYWWRTRSGF
jgi:hypothetical protein